MPYTQTSVTETRVRELLDAYGSDPANWPTVEREAALVVLSRSAALQAHRAHVSTLDNIIAQDRAVQIQDIGTPLALAQRILAGLPVRSQRPAHAHGFGQNLIASLLSPRLAFALATIMAVAVMVYLQPPPDAQLASHNNEFEQWAWYDITGQSLGNQSEVAALSMMDLIEFEISEDGG